MNPEKEIVLALLKDIKRQLEERESAEADINYVHPKWGNLIFTMKTVKIEDPDFEPGTIALDFSINKCSSYLKAGSKEKIVNEVKKFISEPKPILDGITNKYRMLFDYP